MESGSKVLVSVLFLILVFKFTYNKIGPLEVQFYEC